MRLLKSMCIGGFSLAVSLSGCVMEDGFGAIEDEQVELGENFDTEIPEPDGDESEDDQPEDSEVSAFVEEAEEFDQGLDYGVYPVHTATVDFGAGPTELSYEEIEGEAVWQGDIILGPVDFVNAGKFHMVENMDTLIPEGTSASAVAHLYTWPNGEIPYQIDFGRGAQRTRIMAAIQQWNSSSLIRLVPWRGFGHRVRFSATIGGACRSAVGYFAQAGGQHIRIPSGPSDSGCSTGNLLHEIGHTAGLFHEVSRTDRDAVVRMDWSNIKPSKIFNYFTYTALGESGLNFGRYDINSLMHYSSFSTNGIRANEPVLVRAGCSFSIPLAPGCEVLGQRNGLSTGDSAGITRLVAGDPPVKFKIWNGLSNGCLRPRAGSRIAGAEVISTSCVNSESRKWLTYNQPGSNLGGEMIINSYSRLCLEKEASGGIVQMPCTGSTRQRFYFEGHPGIGNGDRIRLFATNRCMRKVSNQSQIILSAACGTAGSYRWYKEL